MANHKRHKPAKQRAAARCQCNPHRKAMGNRVGYGANPRQQLRERMTIKEQVRDRD